MKLIDKYYVEKNKEEIISAIKEGKIFIYPTDTIYGLGCNALLSNSVKKIREIKMRDTKPLSVIAPHKEWVLKNCSVNTEEIDKYLPGPYTLFVKRNSDSVPEEVNPNDDTLGVRIPDHWFTKVVEEVGVPFVTTSVNISGKPHMQSLADLGEEIKSQVDYIIYEGEKAGEPSTKINLINR
jgi:L-threonylcarbamoyladenylate synthase